MQAIRATRRARERPSNNNPSFQSTMHATLVGGLEKNAVSDHISTFNVQYLILSQLFFFFFFFCSKLTDFSLVLPHVLNEFVAQDDTKKGVFLTVARRNGTLNHTMRHQRYYCFTSCSFLYILLFIVHVFQDFFKLGSLFLGKRYIYIGEKKKAG